MKDPETVLARAEDGVRRAETAGADEVEVYVWSASGERVQKARNYQTAKESDVSGVGVRVLKGDRLAQASTDGIAETDIGWAIERALAAVGYVPPSPSFQSFPPPAGDPGAPSPVHDGVMDGDIDHLVAVTEQAGDRIETASGIDYYEIVTGGVRGTYAVANSQGVAAWDRNAYQQCSVELRFEHEGQHKYTNRAAYSRSPLDYDVDIEPELVTGIELIQSTAQSGPLGGSVSTALFDATAARTLVGKLVPSLRGLAVHRDRSHLAGRLGEQIAVDGFTLVDQPRNEDAIRQQRTDDEGIPTQTTPLVRDGTVGTFIFDWSGAQAADAEPTGHGYRPRPNRHSGSPSPKPLNLEMAPGDWSTDEMVEDIDRGILVKGPFLGSFTSSPVTGDFSLVAPLTFLIEKGKIEHVVPSTTVSGNLFEILRKIRAIGEETQRASGGRSSPLLVDGVSAVA